MRYERPLKDILGEKDAAKVAGPGEARGGNQGGGNQGSRWWWGEWERWQADGDGQRWWPRGWRAAKAI